MDFTYDAYFRFLDDARARGYQLRDDFTTDPPADGAILLRHDVDLDLESAVHLAKREREHGVHAVYFVLLTSPFYNVASTAGRDALSAIAGAAHTVGLHFDPTVPNADCAAECAQLEQIRQMPVMEVSFHKPPPTLFGAHRGAVDLGESYGQPRRHTYEPCFVTDIDYCSDSTGQWRFGPPDERESYREGRSMQLLTHPDRWGAARTSQRARRQSILCSLAARSRSRAFAELGA